VVASSSLGAPLTERLALFPPGNRELKGLFA
jgi:hypothetical protein